MTAPFPPPIDPTLTEAIASMHTRLSALTALFERRWRCGVFASGYHNGCKCGPSDPHDGWGCGWRWIAPALSDSEAARLGLPVTDKESAS